MTPIETIATFVLNAGWQIALVGLVALASRPLTRHAPARHRWVLSISTLVLCLLLPLATVRSGHSTGSILPASSSSAIARAEPAPGVVAAPALLLWMVAAAYAGFLALRIFRLLRSLTLTFRLRRSARALELPKAAAAALARCASRFGLRCPQVAWSSTVPVPATVGSLAPVVILPLRLKADASRELWTAVFGHELAHIRRLDFAWNLLVQVLSTPVSFHPYVRRLLGDIQRTREQACDELVTEHLLDGRSYARTLVSVAGRLVSPDDIAHSMGASDGRSLEERVMTLLAGKQPKPLSGVFAIAGAALLFLGTLPISGMAVTVLASSIERPYEAERNAPADDVTAESTSARAYDAAGRRDPFVSPTAHVDGPRLEGSKGLEVDTLALRGIVSTPAGFTGMIQGPDEKTYFVRVGERFYDGTLVGIDPHALTFEIQDARPLVGRRSRTLVLPLHPNDE
jgi:bla regulator protein blaR1